MWCVVGRYFVLTRTGEENEPASSAFTAFLVEGDSPGLTKGKKVLFNTVCGDIDCWTLIGNMREESCLCESCECLQTQSAVANAMVYIPEDRNFLVLWNCMYGMYVVYRLSQQRPVNAWSKLYVSSAKAVRNFDQVSLTQSYDSLHSWMSSSCLSTS